MIQRLTAEAKAKAGRTREAEKIYRALYEADRGDREIAAALIDLYEEQDQLDKSLEVLRDLERRDPANSAVSERIVLDLARAGKFTEAEDGGARPGRAAGPRIGPPAACWRPCFSSAGAPRKGRRSSGR